MSQRNAFLCKLYHLAWTIPPVVWWHRHRKRKLTDEEKNTIAEMLASGYYVILTGTKGHWSSWLVQVATFLKEGILTHYSHSLMNCDFIDDPAKRDEFKFIEATAAQGSHYATFDEVFEDVDYVCLLTPSTMENEDWTAVIDGLVLNNGKPYDDLFDLSTSESVDCVELVLDAFKTLPDYEEHFGNLDAMIKENDGVLLPAMFKECPDFKVAFETGINSLQTQPGDANNVVAQG